MKSKYAKLKYTNTGVKAPVVTLMKSNPDLDRSDMIELNYPEMRITIRRLARKTMYNRAKSLIGVMKDDLLYPILSMILSMMQEWSVKIFT